MAKVCQDHNSVGIFVCTENGLCRFFPPRPFGEIISMSKKDISFIIFAILFFVACISDRNEANQHYEKANLYFTSEEYDSAAVEIRKAQILDSNNLDFKFLEAKIMPYNGLNLEAIELFQVLLSSNYKSDTVSYLIGTCYLNIASYHRVVEPDTAKNKAALILAVEYFDDVIRIYHKYYEGYLGKQRALHELEKYDVAINTLDEALGHFPDSMMLVYSRGVEKYYVGDTLGAIMDIDLSIRRKTMKPVDMSIAFQFRGMIYYRNQEYQSALDCYTAAILYDNANPYTFISRATVYREIGSKDEACADYKKAAEMGYVAIEDVSEIYCK
ncbi:MAG: tetratricopeptide repeat protein [Bacteroidia bacterium]